MRLELYKQVKGDIIIKFLLKIAISNDNSRLILSYFITNQFIIITQFDSAFLFITSLFISLPYALCLSQNSEIPPAYLLVRLWNSFEILLFVSSVLLSDLLVQPLYWFTFLISILFFPKLILLLTNIIIHFRPLFPLHSQIFWGFIIMRMNWVMHNLSIF